MSKKIAIIGAGGYIGGHLLSEIKKSPHLKNAKIITLTRSMLAPLYSGHDSFNCIDPDDYDYYELDDYEDFWVDNYDERHIEPNKNLADILSDIRDSDVLINLAGSGRQSAMNSFENSIVKTTELAVFLAQRANISGIIQMSGLGASAQTPIAYLAAKYAAESFITQHKSELNHVILRPSYVVGGERGNRDQLYAYIQQHKESGKKTPLDIYHCDSLIQPIHIDDVIAVIIWAIKKLTASKSHNYTATLDLVGPDRLSFYKYMSALAKISKVEIRPVTMEELYNKALKSSTTTITPFGIDDLGVIVGGFVGDHNTLSKTTTIKLKSIVHLLESGRLF